MWILSGLGRCLLNIYAGTISFSFRFPHLLLGYGNGSLNAGLLSKTVRVCLFPLGLMLTFGVNPWVPSILGFKPSPNACLPSLPNLTVSDLITYLVRSWNSPLINFIFDPISTSQIHAIHISSISVPDRWIWTASPSGSFSIKSAHEVASRHASFSGSPLIDSDWKLLWGLKL